MASNVKHYDACKPAQNLSREKSREELESQASREYCENMAKFKRILGQRKENVERPHGANKIGAFDDEAYLAMVNETYDQSAEERSRPVNEIRQQQPLFSSA